MRPDGMFCRSAEARTHGSLGYVYELLQDTDKAIDHYEQVRGGLCEKAPGTSTIKIINVEAQNQCITSNVNVRVNVRMF